jgi:ATP-dependent exoDNAse (exonuclease V) beta subunit
MFGAPEEVAKKLKSAGIPVRWQKEVQFSDDQDTVKLITMHSSKGLEFPLVAIFWNWIDA